MHQLKQLLTQRLYDSDMASEQVSEHAAEYVAYMIFMLTTLSCVLVDL